VDYAPVGNKIVQRATVEVLSAIYEQDFRSSVTKFLNPNIPNESAGQCLMSAANR
jgi:hypothetical protein